MSGGQDPSDPFNQWMNGYTQTNSDQEYARMLAAMNSGDPENHHQNADELLCTILELQGFTETVKAFRKLKKWYA